VIVSIQTSFRSVGYAAVSWDTADVPSGVAAALVWRNEYEPGRRFTRALTVEARRLLPITLADDPNWIGRINGLALIVRGNLTQPLLIRGVEAKPMTAVQVLRDRIREWLTFEPWSGGAINNRNGGGGAPGAGNAAGGGGGASSVSAPASLGGASRPFPPPPAAERASGCGSRPPES